MRAAVILFVVLVGVCVAVWLAVLVVNRFRQPQSSKWALSEHSDGECLVVSCVRPGEQPLLVGAVPWTSLDFEYKIEEVRSAGRIKIQALNSDPSLLSSGK